MDGYLVTVRTSMEDIPVGLLDSEDEAEAFALTYNVRSDKFKQAQDVYGYDGDEDEPLNICITKFEDGVPVDSNIIVYLEW